MKRRLNFYRGDDQGRVRFVHYTETERLLRHVLKHNGFNVSEVDCTLAVPDVPKVSVPVDKAP